jgi:ActR/RegA family two-component response regulator
MNTPTPQRRILVVDDGRAYARLLVALRSRAGHDVFAAQTAQDAIGTVVDSPPDLALVDVRLPGDCGLIIGAARHSQFDVHFGVLSGRSFLTPCNKHAPSAPTPA